MSPRTFLKEFGLVTTCAVLGIAFLTGLGTWQLKRLSWKEALIHTMEAHRKAPRLPLETFLEKDLSYTDHEYQRLTLKGRYLHGQESHLLGRTQGGQVVYHIVTPFLLNSGTAVLVDRGWVPAKISATDLSIERPGEEVEESVYIRTKTAVNFFTPENNYPKGVLYSLNPEAYAGAHAMTTLLPFYVVREGESQAYPRPQETTAFPEIRNQHLVYALTWYTLALVLMVVYILFVRQKLQKGGSLFRPASRPRSPLTPAVKGTK